MKNLPTDENWEKEFDEQFGSLTLGILSGEKGSPVFVNNELEVPRLKNFIREKIAAGEKSGAGKANKAMLKVVTTLRNADLPKETTVKSLLASLVHDLEARSISGEEGI